MKPDNETRRERRARGEATLAKVNKRIGEVKNLVEEISPDFSRLTLEFAYGDVFSRPGLDLKTRELCTVAALTAMGTAAVQTPLKIHLRGALLAGATKEEIVETILHMTVYAGFPNAQHALLVAREVFQET